MPRVENTTADDLEFPSAAGVAVPITAGSVVDVDDATAELLEGHPHLRVSRAKASKPVTTKKAAAAKKAAVAKKAAAPSSPAAIDPPATSADVKE